MPVSTAERLWGPWLAFDHPVTLWLTIGLSAAVVVGLASGGLLHRMGRIDVALRDELRRRSLTWIVLGLLVAGPLLLGAGPTMAMVCVLSLLCYREYARATGLFRHYLLSGWVVLAILGVNFAVVDHWYGLFVAMWPLSVVVLAGAAIFADQPQGYIQRTALAIFAFAMFGAGLGHLGYFANDAGYRPVLLWLIAAVELNDVFAFCSGKLAGHRKLCPRTSPNKTIGGAIGAVILTTLFTAVVGHYVFIGRPLDRVVHLVMLGLIVSIGGQLGDLMLSSIKRDLGIKDFAATLPGHGGLLDRFDSILLVAPAVFHYVGYFGNGIGLDQATRIISG